MKLLAITINYKTPDMTIDAVAALMPELAGLSSRVIIVDNDSRDGSHLRMRARLDAEPWGQRVELVESGHNGGFGFGNNFAIRLGLASDDPPDYIYLLNSDAFPENGAIRTLIEFMDSHPEVGIAGSYVHGVDGRPHETAFRFPSVASELESTLRLGPVSRLLSRYVVPILPMPSTPVEVDWTAGASMILRRRMLDEVGLFDEGFFLYFEETDLCLRAKQAGWSTWYVPTASVAHVGSASTGAYSTDKRRSRYWFDSRRRYYDKHLGWAGRQAADIALVAGQASWEVRRRIQQKPRADPKRFLADFLAHKFSPFKSAPR